MVLRLLAVYVAAVLAALIAGRRWIGPISGRAALFLALTPLLVTGTAVFSGGVFAPIDISYQTDPLASERARLGVGEPKNAVLGDVVYQEIPWRAAVRDAIRHGRAPLWNPYQLCGEPLLAMMLPAVLHPFTWIGMLLPLPQAWTLEMTLGVFLALVSAFLFFRDLELSELASAFGAAAWAFCDYLRFYAGWPLSPTAAAFPLLLLGLRRLARDRNFRAFALTSAALFLILNAGHPESALHAVAGGGIWFLFCLAREPGRAKASAIALSFLAGALVLGLTAVVLLPHSEALRQTYEFWFRSEWWAHQKKSLPWARALETLQQIGIPWAFGLPGHGRMAQGAQVPQAYLGALLLPFAAAGAASKRREKWPLFAIALLGFGAWAHLPGITDAIASLPLFDLAINERLVFLGCFALAALAALGFDAIRGGKGKAVFWTAAACTFAGLGAGVLLIRPRVIALYMTPADANVQLAFQIVPLLAGTVVLLIAARGPRRFLWAGPALVGLLLLERVAETGQLYPTIAARAFYPPLAILDPVSRDAPHRVASIGMGFLPNVANLYRVEDVRGYEAMTFKPLFETFPLWSIHQPVWFNRIDDPDRPFLSFLNMRYVVAAPGLGAPPGWRTLATTRGGTLWENPGALPRAFIPAELWCEPDADHRVRVMQTIADFRERGVIAGGPTETEHRWIANGSGRVEIASYAPEKMVLDIDANAPMLVATSTTNWKGWRVEVDGASVPIVEYNRAFVSFGVVAGRHRAVMRYLPTSVIAGAAISVFSAIVTLGLSLFSSRRRARWSYPPGVDRRPSTAIETSSSTSTSPRKVSTAAPIAATSATAPIFPTRRTSASTRSSPNSRPSASRVSGTPSE